jgi:uncharacterized membrane protein YphA (DoxX/SURF4 family)
MTVKQWTDHFIFEEYKTSASSLGIYRVLFATYILLVDLPQHLWIAHFPDSFFNPPIGLTMFFTGFPGASFFLVVNALAIIAAVCLLFGYRTRTASTSFALSLLICNCWAYSFGKINHDIFLILIPLIMQHAGWGNAYSMDAQRRAAEGGTEEETSAWPMALMALVVGLGMMSAAAPKAASGWLDPHSHAVRAHVLFNDFVTGRSTWFTERLLQINSSVFWKFLDYEAVLIEAAFLLTVARRRAFRVVCALACFFHLGIALTMEIAYVPNIMAYAAFCEWSVLESQVGGLLSVWNRLLGRIAVPWLLGSGATVALVYLRFGNPLQLSQEWDPVGLAICTLSAFVAAVFLIGTVRSWFRTAASSTNGRHWPQPERAK